MEAGQEVVGGDQRLRRRRRDDLGRRLEDAPQVEVDAVVAGGRALAGAEVDPAGVAVHQAVEPLEPAERRPLPPGRARVRAGVDDPGEDVALAEPPVAVGGGQGPVTGGQGQVGDGAPGAGGRRGWPAATV